MSETFWISLSATLSGFLGPVVLGALGYFYARAARQEDYARQDKVAEKAREVATLLASTSMVTSKKLDVLKVQSDATHALVNSNYSEIMQTLLDSLVAQLVLMEKDKAKPSDIEAIKARITQLRESLAERGRAADIITAKAKEANS